MKMKIITLKANAKINWTLDITGRREDGYHLMDSLMQHVNLSDKITVTGQSKGISLQISPSILPKDERNIAWKAATLFFSYTGIDSGCIIKLTKHIPVCAGMGGGSADAAGVLFALNQLYETCLSTKELAALALKLGADVPYMLADGLVRAKGIGEILEPLSCSQHYHLLGVTPGRGASTKEIFTVFDSQEKSNTPQTEKMISALSSGDLEQFSHYMGNVLQPVTEGLIPGIRSLEELLLANGAKAAAMTGSGSCVFGVYSSEDDAKLAAQIIPPSLWHRVFSTCEKGIEIIGTK